MLLFALFLAFGLLSFVGYHWWKRWSYDALLRLALRRNDQKLAILETKLKLNEAIKGIEYMKRDRSRMPLFLCHSERPCPMGTVPGDEQSVWLVPNRFPSVKATSRACAEQLQHIGRLERLIARFDVYKPFQSSTAFSEVIEASTKAHLPMSDIINACYPGGSRTKDLNLTAEGWTTGDERCDWIIFEELKKLSLS